MTILVLTDELVPFRLGSCFSVGFMRLCIIRLLLLLLYELYQSYTNKKRKKREKRVAETIAEKVIIFQRTMTKKVVAF